MWNRIKKFMKAAWMVTIEFIKAALMSIVMFAATFGIAMVMILAFGRVTSPAQYAGMIGWRALWMRGWSSKPMLTIG